MNEESRVTEIQGSHDPKLLEGFIQLLSTSTMFEMDLIGKNLQLNGIDAQWFNPDVTESSAERSTVYVKSGQEENALSILSSLDLLDFTTYDGK